MAELYESDLTRMIRDLLRDQPQILEERRRGRGMFWDRRLDPEAQKGYAEAKVPQKGYVYQSG